MLLFSEFVESECELAIRWIMAILGVLTLYKGSKFFARDYQYFHSIWSTTLKIVLSNLLLSFGLGLLAHSLSAHYIAVGLTCSFINICAVFIERYKPTRWSDRSYDKSD
jgi:hypothetical protein